MTSPVSRAYWEERSTRDTSAIVDDVHSIIRSFEPSFELKFNKHFIGLARNGKPDHFVVFQPRKQWLRIGVALPQTDETTARLDQVGLKAEYDPRGRRYVVNLETRDVVKYQAELKSLLQRAF